MLEETVRMNPKVDVRSCYPVVVEWILDICYEEDIDSRVLHLAVHLVQKTLSFEQVPLTRWQLVAAACLWIACKYESDLTVNASEFVDYACSAFKIKDLVEMEVHILRDVMRYRLLVDTIATFIDEICHESMVTMSTKRMSICISEMSVLELVGLPDRNLAECIVHVARQCTGDELSESKNTNLECMKYIEDCMSKNNTNMYDTIRYRHGEECVFWLRSYVERKTNH